MKQYKVEQVRIYPRASEIYHKRYFFFWVKIDFLIGTTEESIENRLKRFLSETGPVYVNVKD